MDNNRRHTQEDFNKLLNLLRGLSTEELLLLYVEAKTGSEADVDNIPVHILESMEDLGKELNRIYADRVIGGLFTEEE